MTRLEQIEYRLNYLLSQYEQRPAPALRLAIVMLISQRRKLIAQSNKPTEVD